MHIETQNAPLDVELRAVIGDEPNLIANLANAAALIYHSLPELNWAGFYLWEGNELVLGPFQGQIACVRIAPGKGVCGTAAQERRTVLVPNVHEFPGHIACDSASNSEIVVPIIVRGEIAGVLDLDSPKLNRFSTHDQTLLEACVQVLVEHWR